MKRSFSAPSMSANAQPDNEVDAINDSTYDDTGDIYDNEFQSLHNDSPNDLHHVSSSAVESFFEDPSISEFINDLDPSERGAFLYIYIYMMQ